MLMVWDLHPAIDIHSPTPARSLPLSPSNRLQPTAYVISFPHPLTAINAHPSTSKELLVSDSRGSIFLVDWRTDPTSSVHDTWRHASVVELVEPRALAESAIGVAHQWSGSAAWRHHSADV